MKKLFFVLSFAFVCGSAFAQDVKETPATEETTENQATQATQEAEPAKPWRVKGFEPQVRIFLDEGLDKQKNLSLGVDFIASYRFNEIFRLGGGVGVQYVNLRFDEPKQTLKASYEGAVAIPLFANIKVDFLRKKVSPFFAADCGYLFYLPLKDYAKDNKMGVFVRPSFGVDIRFSKCTLCIDIAYKYQARSFENATDAYNGYHQICQSFAVSF